jgi:serine/threonine-protein kinase
LATNLDYPLARQSADRVRPRETFVEAREAQAAPTIAGLPDQGTEIVGRYRLLRELGRGGAGAVYLAQDQELDRALALKILHRDARVGADARLLAWNEARLAAAIRHPGVVAIYDIDEERGILAMEYLPGGTLAQRIRQSPLGREALPRVRQMLATLSVLHLRGIIHGDVKPANFLFRENGDLVLTDFGLARLGEAPDKSKDAAGTLAYMAAEQFGGGATSASDVYACGIILLECMGDPLSWMGDAMTLLRKQRAGELRWSQELPEAARSLAHADELRTLISQMLLSDPKVRPSAAEAAERLSHLM